VVFGKFSKIMFMILSSPSSPVLDMATVVHMGGGVPWFLCDNIVGKVR